MLKIRGLFSEKDSKTENLERESENQGRVEKVNQPETSETQTDQGKILDQKEDVEESDQKSDEKQSDVQSPTNLEEQNEESEGGNSEFPLINSFVYSYCQVLSYSS